MDAVGIGSQAVNDNYRCQWLVPAKPPLLNLPSNDENIAYCKPLSIMFQWAP
jgi:hypothetical protein